MFYEPSDINGKWANHPHLESLKLACQVQLPIGSALTCSSLTVRRTAPSHRCVNSFSW